MTLDSVAILKAAAIGVGGTAALDLWATFLKLVTGAPATDWAKVGRWLGHLRAGRFVHASIVETVPVRHELLLGWIFHYGIGATYGLLLVWIQGPAWLSKPSVLAPVALSLALLVAPYFVMMPGLGLGVAGSRTPRPNITRLKSALAHTAFGLGMFGTAFVLNRLFGDI